MEETLTQRHLISFDTWDRDEIDLLLRLSGELKKRRAEGEVKTHKVSDLKGFDHKVAGRDIFDLKISDLKIDDLLKNKTLFMIFFEQSTRTRNSLEAAMTQLGGHAHDLTPDKMQITHGETPKDTAMVLSRMGEGISIRNCFYGIGNNYITEVAGYSSIPVISMQDDVYHPLQAIADLMTIQEHFGPDLRGLRVAVSWAYATSHAKPLSVPQSQILLFPRYGIDVVVGHPEEFPLQPRIVEKAKRNAAEAGTALRFVHDMDEAVRDADIVIPKNWGGFASFHTYTDDEEQRGEMKSNLERERGWIFDRRRLSLAGKNVKIMHALPADRGKEVTDEMLDGEHSIIYDEAENRLHTAKGILSLLMGGAVKG